MTDQHQPQVDEAFDALNDETFGDEEDEWEWSGDAPIGELCPSPNQLSLDRDLFPTSATTKLPPPPLHSSNLMTSMSSITNVSGIRRLSDIEKSFSSMVMQDDESDLPDDPAIMKMTKSPHQPLMSSLIHDQSASSDPFSSFSIPANRLSSSVWAPPDQSLFDTTSIPCSLSSGSPVPPAPPSDPWKNSLNQQTTDRQSLANNMNSSNRMVNSLLGIETPVKGNASASGDGPKLIPQPISLQELEASFLSESSSPTKQLEQKSPHAQQAAAAAAAAMVQQMKPMTPNRATGHPSHPMTASPLHVHGPDAMHMMRLPVHPALRMPFQQPLPPTGRGNLVQHPHIQQNFLMIQQAPYRPPAPLPLPPPHQMLHHPFLNPQQMHNIQMQQQRLPYHRVNYVNNSNVLMNRMPNQPHEAIVRRQVDEYAGFMSQKEREWLIRIQKLQLESSISDPYVEDYYAMSYNSKKLAAAKSRESQAAPALVLMEPRMISRGPASSSIGNNNNHSSSRSDTSLSGNQNRTGASSYVPLHFENTLGKIQVSNIQCPRKLLDLMSLSEKRAQAPANSAVARHSAESAESAKPLARKELTKFRKLLLEIERLYLILLKIDQEDKRMAALPPDQRQPHFESREQLCRELFEGLTHRSDHPQTPIRLNVEIASIRKGCALIFRSLQLLQDVTQKETIITDLLDEENFHLIANQKDKDLYSLDYLKILFEAMKSINPSLTDEELTKVSL